MLWPSGSEIICSIFLKAAIKALLLDGVGNSCYFITTYLSRLPCGCSLCLGGGCTRCTVFLYYWCPTCAHTYWQYTSECLPADTFFGFWLAFWTLAAPLFGPHSRSSVTELNQKVCASWPEDCASQRLWASEGALVCQWVDVWEQICQFALHSGLFFVSSQPKYEVLLRVKKKAQRSLLIRRLETDLLLKNPQQARIIFHGWENVIHCEVNASR